MPPSTTLTLELPEHLAAELTSEARRAGLPTEEYARTLLAGRNMVARPTLGNGAELVAYWQSEGVIGSRPDIGSASEQARRIRRQAEHRHHS